MKRTPIRKVSSRQAKVNRERRKFVAEQLADRHWCEANIVFIEPGYDQCLGRATELHEPHLRSQGGSILDVANSVAICRVCHRLAHDNVAKAMEIGLIVSGYS